MQSFTAPMLTQNLVYDYADLCACRANTAQLMCRQKKKTQHHKITTQRTPRESCGHEQSQLEKNSFNNEGRFLIVALLRAAHGHLTQALYASSYVVTMGVVGSRICERDSPRCVTRCCIKQGHPYTGQNLCKVHPLTVGIHRQ